MYSSANVRVGIILVAKEETYGSYGLEPYLRRAATYASAGYRTVYLWSRGRKRGVITKTSAASLCQTGGFEQLLKQTDVSIGKPHSNDIITCIPLRIDRVALIQAAWDRLERAMHDRSEVSATVLNVEREGIDIDLYGLNIRIQNPHLAGLTIPDARRCFNRGEELLVKVLEADQASNHVVASNVGSETDPKSLVDAFARETGNTMPATVIGYSSVDGLETGLRIRFEGTPTPGYMRRSKACWSRFIPLSEKYPNNCRIHVRVLAFRNDYNTWDSELADLQDPWVGLPDYKSGDIVEVTIREIAERYLICEIAEGAEGVVYTNEIAWGDDESRRQVVESLKPGQNVAARIQELFRDQRTLRLSLKRVSPSAAEALYLSLKGKTTEVRVTQVKDSGALVRLEDLGQDAFIPRGELTWGYCNSVADILELDQVIVVRIIAYRDDFDSVVASLKAATANEFERCREQLTQDDEVERTVLAVSNDLAYVELPFGGTTAAAYVHKSEVSNNLFVTSEFLREMLPKRCVFSFLIKRFDDQHRVVELSRRRWLKAHYAELKYGSPYLCRAIVFEKGKTLLYGNDLECRVSSPALRMGEEREVFVARKGENDRDLHIEL